MEYLDFDIGVSPGESGVYRIKVLESPAGHISDQMTLSLDAPAIADFLDALDYGGPASRAGGREAPSANAKPLQEASAGFGKQLFVSLLPSEIRGLYRTSLNIARQSQKGLRLRLRIDAPDLAALPWEYLFDEVDGDYICLSKFTPIVRYIEVARPAEMLSIKPPLKILVMISDPDDLTQLDTDAEKALLTDAISNLVDAGRVEVTWLEGKTWESLAEAIEAEEWHVFHFTGHGGFDEESGEGLVYMCNEHRNSVAVSATSLGRLLANQPSLRLAILNSCEGARADRTDLFSSSAAALIRRGIPAVLSMQYEITDQAALEFARALYQKLVAGMPVEEALRFARFAITMKDERSLEWGTPVLHMHTDDGKLFEFDVAGALFGDKANEVQPHGSEQENTAASSSPIADHEMSSRTQQGLQILHNKVSQFWIAGVLERSLQTFGLLELGLDDMPVMVDNPWGSMPLAEYEKIIDVYHNRGGSMLILGEPGAGKTTTMLALAKDLLGQAADVATRPVPVVLNLSSWSAEDNELSPWLAGELSLKYLIPRKIATQWIVEGRLLLMLDGLDEVGDANRAACVAAINVFTVSSPTTGVIVCSRFKEYISLSTRLNLNVALRIRLLDRETILQIIDNAGSGASGLLAAIQKDSSLLTLAETPFMLSMMIRTYQDATPEKLQTDGLQTIEMHKRRLMEAFVQRQFRMVATNV